MLITIDPGHGQYSNPYFHVAGFYEGTQMWILAGYLEKELKKRGFTVVNTRPLITDNPSLESRGCAAAKNNSAMFLSLHSNACDSVSVRRTEIYHSIKGMQYADLAGNLAVCVAGLMKHDIKLVRTRPSDKKPVDDFYGVIRSAANNGCTCAMILEHGFHTNKTDVSFFTSEPDLMRLAAAEANVIADYFKVRPAPEPAPEPFLGETPILSAFTASVGKAKTWAFEKGATDTFISLADIYWHEAKSAGVNPVAAYCQSAKETAYGKFGGVLDSSYCNPCGLKIREGGEDNDKHAHKRFVDWTEGVRAHIDHLALYAGADGYPKADTDTPDPRHFKWLFGRSKTMEMIGGQWAPSPEYGKEIVAMMRSLEHTEDKRGHEDIEVTLQNAIDDGAITTKEYWRGILMGRRNADPEYIKTVMDRYHMKVKGMKL